MSCVDRPTLIIADTTVGVVLGGCGTLLAVRRRNSLVGLLLLLGSACWFLGSFWTFAVFLHRGPLLHVHISYPTGRIRRPLGIITVTLAYLTSIVEAIAGNPWLTLVMASCVALAAADIYVRTSGQLAEPAAPHSPQRSVSPRYSPWARPISCCTGIATAWCCCSTTPSSAQSQSS